MFDPTDSTRESLEEAKIRIDNPVLCDIYLALLQCRKNILSVNPEEYAAFPVNGEPDLTYKLCGIQQTFVNGIYQYEGCNVEKD